MGEIKQSLDAGIQRREALEELEEMQREKERAQGEREELKQNVKKMGERIQRVCATTLVPHSCR